MDDAGFTAAADITTVSQLQLRRLAPEPDWSMRAMALGMALDEAGPGPTSNGTTAFLVAPPFSGLDAPLWRLAEARQWQVIEPPEELGMGPEEAAAWWNAQPLDRPWVIPELAKFWLRHYAGLALVKELFNRVTLGHTAPGIVGCSSWCWSFWYRYLSDLPVTVYTPAPMRAEELSVWLESLPGDGSGLPLRVRKSNNGYWVLPLDEPNAANGARLSTYLKDLAALARGNPGVALAIWQRALRVRPDEALPEGEAGPAKATVAGHRDCWVVPLDQVALPSVSTISRPAGLVLHAVLLHSGLNRQRLALVTGLSPGEVEGALGYLERYDLVVNQDEAWQVTPQGYPWVRRRLQSEGYPVDGF